MPREIRRGNKTYMCEWEMRPNESGELVEVEATLTESDIDELEEIDAEEAAFLAEIKKQEEEEEEKEAQK